MIEVGEGQIFNGDDRWVGPVVSSGQRMAHSVTRSRVLVNLLLGIDSIAVSARKYDTISSMIAAILEVNLHLKAIEPCTTPD